MSNKSDSQFYSDLLPVQRTVRHAQNRRLRRIIACLMIAFSLGAAFGMLLCHSLLAVEEHKGLLVGTECLIKSIM